MLLMAATLMPGERGGLWGEDSAGAGDSATQGLRKHNMGSRGVNQIQTQPGAALALASSKGLC